VAPALIEFGHLAAKIIADNLQLPRGCPQSLRDRMFLEQDETPARLERRRDDLRPAHDIRQPDEHAARGIDEIERSLV